MTSFIRLLQHIEAAAAFRPESAYSDEEPDIDIPREANEGLDVEGPGIPPRLMAILGIVCRYFSCCAPGLLCTG